MALYKQLKLTSISPEKVAPLHVRSSSDGNVLRKWASPLELPKRSLVSTSLASTLHCSAGGNGPHPPTGNGGYRPEDGDWNDDHTPSSLVHAVLTVTVATTTLLGVYARPAAAAEEGTAVPLGSDSLDLGQGSSNMVHWQPAIPKQKEAIECVCCDDFTAEELELLAPRQYRVREWVFVH